MYTRLIQGYEAMDTEQQTASAFAARQLRLMVCSLEDSLHYDFFPYYIKIFHGYSPAKVNQCVYPY